MNPKPGIMTSEFWMNIATIAGVLSLAFTDVVNRGLIPIDTNIYKVVVATVTTLTVIYTISRTVVKSFGGDGKLVDRVYTNPNVPVYDIPTTPTTPLPPVAYGATPSDHIAAS